MKKFAAALLAALIVLSMTAFAATATEVAQLGEERYSVIRDTNLMYVRENEGYALADMNGNRLTGADYYYDFYQYHGHLTVTKMEAEDELNAKGLLALDGSEEVPFQYGDVEVLNENWAVGVKLTVAEGEEYDYKSWTSDDKYLIETADVYYLPEKKLMTSLTRDQYADAEARGHYINLEDRTGHVVAYDSTLTEVAEPSYTFNFEYLPAELKIVMNDEYLRGVEDGEGNVIVDCAFESLYVDEHTLANGLIEYGVDGKEGLIDMEGNIVVPAEYDRVHATRQGAYEPAETMRYVHGGYICVEKDGKYGYVDTQGNVTCKVSIDKEDATNWGLCVMIDKDDKKSLVAADGVKTDLSDYDNAYFMENSAGRYFKVRNEDGAHGLIDWHGEIVVPLEYDSLSMMGDGQHMLAIKGSEYKILKIEE